MKRRIPVIGITLGDPAGIGPEVVGKALRSGRLPRNVGYQVLLPREIPRVRPGRVSVAGAAFALESLEMALELCCSGGIDAVVTAPVNKTGLKLAGFPFPGQTEFFAEGSGAGRHAMMLVGGGLRVALVTTHVPLKDVSRLLTAEKIVEVTGLAVEHCHQAGIRSPRIGVLGLNPHAGEIGDEEAEIIAPAVARARRKLRRARISGPLSPDTAFHHAVGGAYDAMVCMYHDQGLIPLKMRAFDTGVNVTLGLPFVRTSPDHGTAYDIAGRGKARPDSMIAALSLAGTLLGRRA